MTPQTLAPAPFTRSDPAPLLNRGAVPQAPEASPAPQAEPPAPETRANTQAAPTTGRAAVNAEIRSLATTFDLGSDWANGLIDRGASEGEARAAALDSLRSRGAAPNLAPRLTVLATHDPDPAQLSLRMAEALYATRINIRHQLSEPAKPYAAMTTLDMARECLRVRGIQTTGLSPADTITRALHATSDFPAIFADTANRSLRAAYDAAPATLKRAARQTTAKDFRAKTSVQLSEAPTLEKVNEGGEYRYGSMADAKESYAIDTYGRIFGISRKAIINDDIGAFSDLAGQLGQAAADFEAQFLVDLIVKNSGAGPTMGDGTTLFHATRNNSVTGATGAIDVTKLSQARLAMRRQKGLAGRAINVVPKFLIVPPERETEAEQILAAIQATASTDVNVFSGKMELLVESRLSSALRWYIAADPASVDGLEYAYLQGSEGPQIETRTGFEVDGVETKVRLDFGAAFLDWRSWWTNSGA